MKPTSRAGIGASSIMLIIVVLCLTAFGTLTFLSARQDNRMTDRTAEAAAAYYAADAAAQRMLSKIDAALAAGADPAEIPGVDGYDAAEGILTFTAQKDQGRAIRAQLLLTGEEAVRWRILEYRLIQTEQWGG